MNISKFFREKRLDPKNKKNPTIAFLGDSVTQGCFDVYINENGAPETYYDKGAAYHNYIAKIFEVLFPSVPVNIINAGISGDNAVHGLERLERDVLKFQPDLTVICFGLNDCGNGMEGIEKYANALDEIFDKVKASGSEIIFMTPNMMNTKISCHIKDERLLAIAEGTMKTQTEGILTAYLNRAKEVACKHNVPVCDVYEKWNKLAEAGVDTTDLLANFINHPSKEMNWLFAYELVRMMMFGERR